MTNRERELADMGLEYAEGVDDAEVTDLVADYIRDYAIEDGIARVNAEGAIVTDARAEALATIHRLIAEFGISVEDLLPKEQDNGKVS